MSLEKEPTMTEQEEIFKSQQEIMNKIMEQGFGEYVEALPNLPDAFDLEENKPEANLHRCICCMDERTNFGLHAAGSGILLSEKDFEKYWQQAKPDSISSHTGCGAAKLYAKKMGLNIDEADKIAREWSEKKAKEMGVPHVHLEVEKPFHYARVCYYDGTGKFNFKAVKGLPEGFVVGRKFMSQEQSLAECTVARDIIFGHHGFGELLNEENPFLYIAIAETEGELNKLKDELADLAEASGGKILVDGFLSPKQEK